MRTDAPAAILANYMRAHKTVRWYVHIPELNLFLGTRTATLDGTMFENRIGDSGTITWDSPYFGGMGSVSNTTVRNLELDRNLSFADTADIEPSLQGGVIGAGRVVHEGAGDETYEMVREASTGAFSATSIIVGRQRVPSVPGYRYNTMRGLFMYDVPGDVGSCDEGVIELAGLSSNVIVTGGIELVLVTGTWGVWNQSGIYDDFDGHQPGMTPYTGTVLSERWHSSQFSTTTRNKIRLNEHGRKYIEDNAGGTVRLALLSKKDFDGSSAPYTDEFLKFNSSTAMLKLRYNAIRLINREAVIYLSYDETPTSLASMLRVWTGVVHNYELNEETLDLELRQAKDKHNRTIPTRQINLKDYPDCPETNIGKAYPVVIGEFAATTLHKTGQGNFTAYGPVSGLINYSYPDCFKALVVAATPEKKTALLCEKPIMGHVSPYFVWNRGLQAYELFHILTNNIAFTGVSAKDLAPRTETTGFPHNLCEQQFKALSTILPYKHVVNQIGSQIFDPEAAYDEDSDTYCAITADNCSLDFYFQTPEGVSGSGSVAFLVYAKFVGGADPSDFHFLLVKDQRTSVDDPHDWAVIANQATWTGDGLYLYGFYLIDSDNNRRPIPLEQYRMTLYRNTDDTGEVQVYDVCAVMAYNADDVTELFTYGKGMFFGTWIDEYGRSNPYNVNELVESPPHVIETLARSFMELTSAEINTAAIDASAAKLDGWKFAYELLDLTPGMNHFNDLGEQSKTLVLFDERNRLSTLTFDEDRAFPYAAAATPWLPGELDIFDEDARPANGVYTRHPIDPESFSVSPMREVKNDFRLNYRYNYASGRYEGMLFITHGGGVLSSVETNIDEDLIEGDMTLSGTGGLMDLTSRCYLNILTTNTMSVDCPAIRDEATATRYLQHLVVTHTKERLEAIFRTNDNAILHELWDYINIRHRRLQTVMDTARIEIQRWLIVRKQHSQDSPIITITALEL